MKNRFSSLVKLIKWLLLFPLIPVLGLQNILSAVSSFLPQLGALGGAPPQAAPANVFKKVLSHADWWDTDLESATGEILCKAGVFTCVGRYKVPPQQTYHFGYGSPAYPDNQGYIYLALYDDEATNSLQEHGSVRLVQRNAQGTISLVVAEFRTEQLCGDTADRSKQIALPEQVQFPLVGEDSYLEIHFNPDATDTLVDAAIGTALGADIWNIPVSCFQ